MRYSRFLRGLLAVSLAVVLASCGGGIEIQTSLLPTNQFGTVFLSGTDAPLSSVLAFRVTLTGLTVSNGTTSASLLTQPQDVEFARLNGLRTLLDMRSVPAGTYTSITATLASPVISFLDTSTSPPSIGTLNGTLTQSSVTAQLRQPLTVADGDLIGLLMDFRLAQSLERDASGQLTGNVTPNLVFRVIPPNAPEAEIDELRGGVVSVNAAAGTFVMQGPHGRVFTVTTDANTMIEPGDELTTFDTNTVVEVSGTIQRGTLSIQATAVQVVSRDRFVLGGLLTDVRPASGRADFVDLLVRTELPDLAGIQPGRIATLGFSGNERFMIHHFRLPLSFFAFNRAALLPGQRVSAAGTLDVTQNPPALDTRRVTLHRQGFEGLWEVGSTSGTNKTGHFDFRVGGLTGMLFGRPVRVFTSDRTRFINLSGLSDLSGTQPMQLRVVGLVLKDPVSGNPMVIAWAVEKIVPPTP